MAGQQSTNAKRLLELAAQRFGEFTDAEEKLFVNVADGRLAEFSTENGDNDPAP